MIPALVRMAATDSPSVHEACAAALGDIKPSAYSGAVVAALMEGMKDRDREVRLHAISLLAALGPRAVEAIPALIAALDEPLDSDRGVGRGGTGPIMTVFTGPAHEAAKALGEVARDTSSAGKAVDALAKIVRSGPPQRRASAADALGKFGPAAATAIPDLIQMLHEIDERKNAPPNRDGDAAVQAMVQIAAGSPSLGSVITALRESLRSETSTYRAVVIRALEKLRAKSAIAEIRAQEQNPDAAVRKAAARAVKTLDER